VQQRLPEFGLLSKAENCQFGVREVGFLRFVIHSDGIGMESDRLYTIKDWPTLELVRDVQVLLGFTNFYRRFIWKYVKVMAPILNLLQAQGSQMWEWTRDAESGFWKFKKASTEEPILQHLNPQTLIIQLADARSFARDTMHNQYNGFGISHPVNFYSWTCSPTKQNYDTHDRQLLANVEIMKQSRHYVEGANYKVLIQCDQKDLEYFQTSKELSRRQARWAEILSSYDFFIEHLEERKNPADGPSRRRDYNIG